MSRFVLGMKLEVTSPPMMFPSNVFQPLGEPAGTLVLQALITTKTVCAKAKSKACCELGKERLTSPLELGLELAIDANEGAAKLNEVGLSGPCGTALSSMVFSSDETDRMMHPAGRPAAVTAMPGTSTVVGLVSVRMLP